MKHNRKTTAQTEQTAAPAPTSTAAPVKTAPKAKRLTAEQLAAKYPHADVSTLRWETEGTHANKQTVEALLACGHTHRVATSDLFQVKACPACKKTSKKAAKPTTQPVPAAEAY